MNINEIKQYINKEISLGNDKPFKELRTFITKIYKQRNKEKVKAWNRKYYNKHRKIKGNPYKQKEKLRDTLKKENNMDIF